MKSAWEMEDRRPAVAFDAQQGASGRMVFSLWVPFF